MLLIEQVLVGHGVGAHGQVDPVLPQAVGERVIVTGLHFDHGGRQVGVRTVLDAVLVHVDVCLAAQRAAGEAQVGHFEGDQRIRAFIGDHIEPLLLQVGHAVEVPVGVLHQVIGSRRQVLLDEFPGAVAGTIAVGSGEGAGTGPFQVAGRTEELEGA